MRAFAGLALANQRRSAMEVNRLSKPFRVAAKEVNRLPKAELYVATPPSECLRMVISSVIIIGSR